ncbi:NAD-dependent epimerase/dehydratase family protein [Cytobacillus oceanisediminis]|uniref:NAD-dependent epimerase/dehydratase family protein n=1 Tax=Cytobacillus oceanisediminis TaxID=665099 RepID=UPI001C23DF5E|nr:NAD-dependent epimerase/dehydratase family protein [Cytobacillus oceanisediminis]MBU8769286.1 NAD-dependent epimerase/dehydratase family protein [Cytobacillus oceanisediminis]
MKMLVTGGAGFIGSHLTEELLALDHEVHVLDNLISGSIENLSKQVILHRYDICSFEAKQMIVNLKPDIVFHLAAQSDVGKSIIEPKYDADININGTINILEACREAKVKKVIFASTAAVYGNLKKETISENDATIPISYYGLSKFTAELYIQLFSQLYDLPYTILRYGNVYGPRQKAKGEGGVIAVFLDKIISGDQLYIYGDGEQTRDFIYVKDVAQANIAAIDKGHNEIIQISTSCKTTIKKIVNIFSKIHHSEINTIFKKPRKGDIKNSCLENKKAQKILEWQPKVNIYQGLLKAYNAKFNNK